MSVRFKQNKTKNKSILRIHEPTISLKKEKCVLQPLIQ